MKPHFYDALFGRSPDVIGRLHYRKARCFPFLATLNCSFAALAIREVAITRTWSSLKGITFSSFFLSVERHLLRREKSKDIDRETVEYMQL